MGLTGHTSLQPAWGHEGGSSLPKACLVSLFSLEHQHPEGKGGLPSTPPPAKVPSGLGIINIKAGLCFSLFRGLE